MLEALITFSSFDREEGRGAGSVTELLTDAGHSVTSRDELGFPNINKDVGRLEGGAVLLGFSIGIGYCC